MLKNMSKEELCVLSYTDLAELILKENTKSLSTANIFRTICDLLELSDDEYIDKIGDFYTSLTIDKRFVFMDNNEWNLRENHPVNIVMDEEDEEDVEEIEENDYEEVTEDEEDIDSTTDDELDDVEDDLDDLAILSDEEIEE